LPLDESRRKPGDGHAVKAHKLEVCLAAHRPAIFQKQNPRSGSEPVPFSSRQNYAVNKQYGQNGRAGSPLPAEQMDCQTAARTEIICIRLTKHAWY
jgi:hypothetical protein